MANDLGITELFILSAIAPGEKYGLEIVDWVEKECDKKLSLGGLYTTLNRLEKKGYVTSRWGDPTPERGGYRKKFFQLTGEGQIAFNEVRNSLTSGWNQLPAMSFGG